MIEFYLNIFAMFNVKIYSLFYEDKFVIMSCAYSYKAVEYFFVDV